jgi:DNA gyrase subunit A
MRATPKTGEVVGVQQVMPNDEMMLVTDGGRVIRIGVGGISIVGRNTQGVRLIEVAPGERVVSLARLAEREGGEEIH